jgi:hypothetical protein
MINYIPERIYNKIKDDETYKEIVAAISTKKAECDTFVEYIKSDSDAFYGDKAAEYKAKLEEIVNKYCPEYLIQYKVNNGEYTKEQMLEMYNSKKYDSEYNFFFLSNIINASYEDNTFTEYMGWFIRDYEALDDRDLSILSAYIHLKYMYAKIYITAFTMTSFKDKYYVDLFNIVYSIYKKTLEYTETDIINNYILEAMADSLQVIASRIDDHKKLYPYLELILNFTEELSYQYQNYSYAHAKLLDIRNMLCVYDRDYTGFINGTIILCKYLSSALAVPSKLFKGLNYYDKCNHSMFIVLIRKYLKLKNAIPMLRSNSSVIINNLKPDDYNYALSNITDIDTPSVEHDIVINQYRNTVDSWFNSDNAALNELKDIKI